MLGKLTMSHLLCFAALTLLANAECPKKLTKSFLKSCLKKGFNTTIDGCECAEDQADLSEKASRKCQQMEDELIECGYDCLPECPKKLQNDYVKKCLKKGFNSGIDGCEGASNLADLSEETEQLCQDMEAELVECGYECSSSSEPIKPAELIKKCGHENTLFYGADMFHRMYNDIEDCIRDCQKSKSCVSMTYKANGQCFFKSMKGGSHGARYESGSISMNMEGCVRKSADSYQNCIRDGFDYRGASLGSLVVENIIQCFQYCEDTENCKAIAFRKSTSTCYLKNKSGGSYGPSTNADYQSANIVCENRRFDRSCVRKNIWFYSADLANFAVADIEECAQHCSETENCKAVSFRVSDHRCYLKSKSGGNYPTNNEGHYSMNMECNNRPINNLDCLRQGIVFNAGDIGSIVVADVSECVKRCRDTEECKAITFRQTDNTCFLKSYEGGYTGPTREGSHASMNLECDNRPVRNKGCIRANTNFPGADFRSIMVEEKEECIRLCRDTERCKSLSFIPEDGMINCYMKNRRGGATVPVAQAGTQSMNMECDNSDRELDCLRENVNFRGADIGNGVVTDELKCLEMCRETEGCVAFSFRESDNRCFTKSQRGGSALYKDLGYNSMNMNCTEIPLSESMKCLRYDMDFAGSSISTHLIVADERECIKHCGDTLNCVAMTFRESDHRCYLKNKLGGTYGGSIALGHNSANLKCDNSKPAQLQCNKIEERFSGFEMNHVKVEDMGECLRLCRDAEDCHAVSFRLQDHICEMKRVSFEWWSIKSHYVSVNIRVVQKTLFSSNN